MLATQKFSCRIVAGVLAGQNLNEALNKVWREEPGLLPRQRGAIQDVSYGTLRQLGLIDRMLSQLLQKPLSEPELKALLLVAIYQLQFSRAAPHAIVDHAVTVATQTGAGHGKGLVNGVLRNFLRQKEELFKTAQTSEYGQFSHPAWWIAAMRRTYPQQWREILAANNQHPPMTLRINQSKTNAADYIALLAADEIIASSADGLSIQLQHPVGVDRLPHFFDGWVSVQDLGAQYAARLLDVQDGQRVLDACAAPGGKSGHILELADVALTAVDNDAVRLKRVQENISRLGQSATLLVGDASKPDAWWDGQQFDRILADVPCSATGVVRRHPDIKWLRRSDDFAGFARQQAEMLDALWPLVAPGGKLLYATCSVFAAENTDAVSAFAHRHPEAKRQSLPDFIPADGQLLPTPEHDGFFYALFTKPV